MQNRNFSIYTEAGQANPPRIDIAGRKIYNAIACQIGHAKGHGLYCDEKFLQDLTKKANEKAPLHVHLGHPSFWQTEDPFLQLIGFANNFRNENGKVFCDIQLVDNEKDKQAIDKVLQYATHFPEKFGLSISFTMKEPDSYEEAFINDYITEIVPTGTFVEGSYVMELEDIFAVDIVETPAVNNGLFFKQKSATETAPKPAPKPKTRTKNTFTKNKRNMKKTKTKTFCSCQKMGEATGVNAENQEVTLVWDGDAPEVGASVSIQNEDGSLTVAPDGEYMTEWGKITIEGGFITEIVEQEEDAEAEVEAEAETEQSATNFSVESFEKKLATLEKKAKQIEKTIEKSHNTTEMQKKLSEYKAIKAEFSQIKNSFADFLKNRTMPENAKTNADIKSHAKKLFTAMRKGGFAGLQKAGFTLKHGENTALKRMYKDLVKFSSSLSTEANQACILFYREIYQELFYIEPIFANSTQLPLIGVYGELGIRDLKLPKMSISPIAPATEVLTGNNLTSCNNNTDRVLVEGDSRTFKVCGTQTALFICPKEYRYLFNNAVYVGAEEMPAEAIITALLMEIVAQEVAREILIGTGTGSSWCRGLVNIIEDDITAALIPSGQIFTFGSGGFPSVFDASNVIQELVKIARAVPKRVQNLAKRTGVPVKMFVAQNVFDLFVDVVSGLDGGSLLSLGGLIHAFLDKCCGNFDPNTSFSVIFPFIVGYPLEMVPIDAFSLTTTPSFPLPTVTGRIVIVHPSELFSGMYEVDSIPAPRICYDCATDKIIARVEMATGIQYIEPQNIVVVRP